MKLIIVDRRFFIQVILLAIILTIVPFLQGFPQEENPTSKRLTPLELVIQELDSTVKSATTQEDLAKKAFDMFQDFEYITGISVSTIFFLPHHLKNQPEFSKVLDFIEEKWLSFPIDDYYDEVGIFLLYGNVVAGRVDKANTLFSKMKENLWGKSIDPYFNSNSVMELIHTRVGFCKKAFTPRKDLSLLYAVGIIVEMSQRQQSQEGWDNRWEAIKSARDNYKGTKGAELLGKMYEMKESELKYGSYESIPFEEKKHLSYNQIAAAEEMRKMCGFGSK